MRMDLSPAVRKVLYLVTVVGAPVVAYLNAKGVIGSLEVQLWSAEVAAAGILAAFNTPNESVGKHAAQDLEGN